MGRNDGTKSESGIEFADVRLFTVDEVFVGWQKAHTAHLAEDALFDHNNRPTSEAVACNHAGVFKAVCLVKNADVFGGWAQAQKAH